MSKNDFCYYLLHFAFYQLLKYSRKYKLNMKHLLSFANTRADFILLISKSQLVVKLATLLNVNHSSTFLMMNTAMLAAV